MRVNDVEVLVEGAPHAPVLVLVHGFSSSLHSYDRLAPLLTGTHRVVRLDLLGHGATGGRAADADVQGTMLARVLDGLDLRDVTVVGHSFGADVAIDTAEKSPRVARLVVLAQAPDMIGATFPRGNQVMASPFGPVLHRLATRPTVRKIAQVAFAPGFRPTAQEQEALFVSQRAMDPGMYRVVLVTRRDRMLRDPLDARMARLATPALVVLGGSDQFYGARSADRYRAAGADVHVIAAAGHSVALEAPTEVAALLTAFMVAG